MTVSVTDRFDILDHDLVFLLGGYDGRAPLTEVEVLDVTTGKWEVGPKMASARRDFGVALLDTSIYVAGGSCEQGGVLDSVEYFNLTLGSWRSAPSLSSRRAGLALAVLEGKLFATGGRGGGKVLDVVEILDPRTSQWEAAPSLPKARMSHGVVAWQGRLYSVGGDIGGGGPKLGGAVGGTDPMDLLDIFDAVTMQWEQGSHMHFRRCDLGVAALDGRIYAIGGYGGRLQGGSYLSTMEVYDIDTNKWEAGPSMEHARAGLGVAVHEARIYVFGGPFAGVGMTTVEVLDTSTGEWGIGPATHSRRFGVRTVVHFGSHRLIQDRDETRRLKARVELARAHLEASCGDAGNYASRALTAALVEARAAGLHPQELEAAELADEELRLATASPAMRSEKSRSASEWERRPEVLATAGAATSPSAGDSEPHGGAFYSKPVAEKR